MTNISSSAKQSTARLILYRAPILFQIAILFILTSINLEQIRSLLSEAHTAAQALLNIGATSVTSITLLTLARKKSGQEIRTFDYLDLALALIPVLIISSAIRTNSMAGDAICFIFSALVFLCLYKRRAININDNRIYLIVLSGSIATWLTIALGVLANPVELPRYLGSIFFIIIFFFLVLIYLQLTIARPPLGIPVVTAALIMFFINEPNHDLRVKDFTDYASTQKNIEAFRDPISIQDAFDMWLASRNDLEKYRTSNTDYPVFLISSEGGGGYAAAHSYLFLSKMQKRCPNFAQHIFAITGVSGGAVGNALFWSSLKDDTNPVDPMECLQTVDISEELEVLTRDNLSPVIGAMLFRDLPNKLLLGLIPGPDRSRVLISALSGSSEIGDFRNPFFFDHYWAQEEDGSRQPRGGPAIIPIATNLVSGKPYIISPFEIDDLRNGFEQTSCENCDLSRIVSDGVGLRTADVGFFDAAVASASFPYVTPSLSIRNFGGRQVGLVDGGYLDNSGSEVLLEIARALHWPNRFFSGNSPAKLNFPPSTAENARTRACYSNLYDGLHITVRARPLEARRYDGNDADSTAEQNPCDVSVKFFTITIRAEPSSGRYLSKQNFFTDPISALLHGRSRRAELARLRLFDFQCTAGPICSRDVGRGADLGFLDSVIRPQDFSLPLGWKLPKDALFEMSKLIAPDPDALFDADLGIIEEHIKNSSGQADVFESVSGNPYSVQAIVSAFKH